MTSPSLYQKLFLCKRFLFCLICFYISTTVVFGQEEKDYKTATAGAHYLKNGFHRFWWGKHYRKVWAEPVQVPLFWTSKFREGLTPLKQGGSFQTKNLRLVDKQGHEFVLRSIDKDPSRALPEKIRNTFVADLMRDQTSVIHPYGALIVPALADAAQVYHTNPQLVVVAEDSALGEFKEEFSGMLAILEERPDGDWKGLDSFGNPSEVISSRKAFSSLLKESSVHVDATRYLRSRLFDMWLSDWSRREDQWRWGVKKKGEKTILEPIPRDRDHAFFLFNDGVLTKVVGLFKPNYQSFDNHISASDNKGLTKASRQMDAYLLRYLSEEEFIETAQDLQQKLTDEVIQAALQNWPPQIRNLTEKQFTERLSSRRQDLTDAARYFYRLLNAHVLLPGTDQKDKFTLQLQQDGNLLVQQFSEDKKEKWELVHQRTFKPKETKSINFYGLGEEDTFDIKGKGKNRFKLVWIGGEEEDKLVLPDLWELNGKQPIILDERDGNNYKEKRGSIRIQEHIPKANEYNGRGWLLRHRLHD